MRQIRSCLRTGSTCDGFVVLEPFVHGMISGDLGGALEGDGKYVSCIYVLMCECIYIRWKWTFNLWLTQEEAPDEQLFYIQSESKIFLSAHILRV